MEARFDAILHKLKQSNEDEVKEIVNDLNDLQDEVDLNTAYREIGHIPLSEKGVPNGVAELDDTGKVPSTQLPSYVDDVLEFDSVADFPATGEEGKIYVAKDTNLTYRWTGTQYTEVSQSLALGETDQTAYRGDRGKIAYDHSQLTSGNPHNVDKADVGLDQVDNTSDLDKPISDATQNALDGKVSSIVAGANVSVDNTDPQNPIVSTSSGGDMKKSVYDANDNGVVDDSEAVNGHDSSYLLSRSNHTGTQQASTISDFDVEVSNNSSVSANTTHRGRTDNPHSVTKAQVGLGNVDNTSDADKPVSTAQQSALNLKADKSNVLELNNTTAFTPDSNYEPATKKYVDDEITVAKYGQIDFFIPGNYNDAVDNTLLWSDLNTEPMWKLPNAHFKSMTVMHKTVDTTAQPSVALNISGTNQTSVQLGSSAQHVTISLNSAIATNQSFDIAITNLNGGDGNAGDLTLCCLYELD